MSMPPMYSWLLELEKLNYRFYVASSSFPEGPVDNFDVHLDVKDYVDNELAQILHKYSVSQERSHGELVFIDGTRMLGKWKVTGCLMSSYEFADVDASDKESKILLFSARFKGKITGPFNSQDERVSRIEPIRQIPPMHRF